MRKLFYIIAREYITRVRTRSFILTTFLAPLMFLALPLLITFFGKSMSGSVSEVVFLDKSGLFANFQPPDKSDGSLYFKKALAEQNEDSLLKNENTDAVIVIPADFNIQNTGRTPIRFISKSRVGINTRSFIKENVDDIVFEKKVKTLVGDTMSAEFFKTTPVINFERFDEKKEKSGFVALASIFGHLIGFLIYIALNLYGVMIMRGVMEEKNSRIVEVLVSSVKPWQLMIGKISGVGLVGLTQFFMWGVTMIVGGLLFAPLMGLLAPSMPMSDMSSAANAVDQSQITELLNELKDFDFKTILLGSFFYFVGGYFLYGALFAAIGAAGVDESNAQSLTFPIVAPIILAIFLMMRAMNDPEGSIAFWGSIIPFTSPIVMPSLLPFSPPLWQIGLSLSILLLTILFTSYIAGKIYRTGILMQGKKISFKEMVKWLFS